MFGIKKLVFVLGVDEMENENLTLRYVYCQGFIS